MNTKLTAQKYIMSQLERLSAPSALEVPKDDAAMLDFIYNTLMSKKFRKYASTPEQQQRIKEAIATNVKNKSPIKLILPFGGYKLWRFEESPEVDWAELFMLMYYAKWLKPIASVYAPGVHFDFASDEAIIERMNNIPRADTERYTRTFKATVAFLQHYHPESLHFTLTSLRERYTEKEFEEDLQHQITSLKEKFHGGYATLTDAQKDMIDLNVKLLPNQSEDPQWREKNDLIHNAYLSMSKRRPYFKLPEKIAVFPTLLPYPAAVAVGTTKTSIAKFWVGVGALQRRGDSFIETVLSPSQLEKAQVEWEPASISGLDGKNFKQVRIV